MVALRKSCRSSTLLRKRSISPFLPTTGGAISFTSRISKTCPTTPPGPTRTR
ncbi:hypothetical protein L917_06800 [Phytophthora nicotianae]|uniref:Uncharacterized protein n=1 Tax=Phytophthora nicotianae TaxID=4792 RepID=W2NIZ9_PHYNI|nr:hypothetical protein L915_06982 [Phytophthora nicotianae]ETL42204.1 hypothetical protein L916_06933 [Phytophthora nicotianae]ETL95379.1 hypothetical protein L917_06800 [Phytophthora nicotianae]ETM48571.1 hypothetical protein L914_06899 [Phytophthora nicotianae]